MKILYLAGSFISFVIILVLAFENIQASCNYLNFFFWELPAVSPTFILFGSSFLGMIAGGLVTMTLLSFFGSSDEDEEDEDFNA